MTDKERLEEIIDAIAYLRDEYIDTEMVSEYYGHDIKAEIFSCPISALSYTGDYIELLQKRVQELERKIERYRRALEEIRDIGICGKIISTGEIIRSDEANLAEEALEGEGK